MRLLVEIPENMKAYADKGEFNVLSEAAYGSAALLAIANGQPIPDDCEILTREAYEDLCKRASMSEQERWRNGT